MCLLLEHGMRASEVAALELRHIDQKAGTMRFFRPKTTVWTTHELTPATRAALTAYLDTAAPVDKLLLPTDRSGHMLPGSMTERAITKRVKHLGKKIGFVRWDAAKEQHTGTLSAHDCRHHCAGTIAADRPDVKFLCDWFGWNSPAMALRYIEGQKVLTR